MADAVRMIVVAAVAALAVGCGPTGLQRYDVSGMVTHDGAPVPAGTVSFVPLGGDRPQPYGFCEIKAGRYATRTGKSPGSGRYRVIVFGGDGIPFQAKIADVVVNHPHGKPLFPTHVFEVDLPARHGGVFDFDVPTAYADVSAANEKRALAGTTRFEFPEPGASPAVVR